MVEPAFPAAGPRAGAEDEREHALTRLLRDRIRAEGPIRWDAFMEISLYHPQFGYYTHSGANPFGPRGDFYTAGRVTPVFAQTLARRLLRAYADAGKTPDFRIVELGAGDGALGSELVRALNELDPRSMEWTYVVVERNRSQAELAAQRLQSGAPHAVLRVLARTGLAADGPFSGVVFANELLDAMPARRLVRHADRWYDLAVRWANDRFSWERGGMEVTVGDPALPSADEGTVLEWVPQAGAFLRELADHLHRGLALFLDYGATEDELVRARGGGTLQALEAHRSRADPLATPGRVDLSTFVNWTRWREAARTAGLRELSLARQVNALESWGVEEVAKMWVERASGDEERVRRHLSMKNLFFGFENFWAWELVPASSAGSTPPVR